MNGMKLVVVVFVLLAFIAGGVSVALASAEPVDDLFAALSDQELDAALDVFAADAVVNDEACHQYYAGQDEISDALNLWAHDGREFEIVEIEENGDRVTATVDISNNGHTWAQEKIEAVVEDGKLQQIDVTSFEFQFWRV